MQFVSVWSTNVIRPPYRCKLHIQPCPCLCQAHHVLSGWPVNLQAHCCRCIAELLLTHEGVHGLGLVHSAHLIGQRPTITGKQHVNDHPSPAQPACPCMCHVMLSDIYTCRNAVHSALFCNYCNAHQQEQRCSALVTGKYMHVILLPAIVLPFAYASQTPCKKQHCGAPRHCSPEKDADHNSTPQFCHAEEEAIGPVAHHLQQPMQACITDTACTSTWADATSASTQSSCGPATQQAPVNPCARHAGPQARVGGRAVALAPPKLR